MKKSNIFHVLVLLVAIVTLSCQKSEKKKLKLLLKQHQTRLLKKKKQPVGNYFLMVPRSMDGSAITVIRSVRYGR